jgi:hypothetical protein
VPGPTIFGCRAFLKLPCAIVLLTALSSNPIATAADKDASKEGGKVAGILIDKKDDWITVKADGEDEPVKYLIGGDPGKKVAESMKIHLRRVPRATDLQERRRLTPHELRGRVRIVMETPLLDSIPQYVAAGMGIALVHIGQQKFPDIRLHIRPLADGEDSLCVTAITCRGAHLSPPVEEFRETLRRFLSGLAAAEN